MEGPNIPGPKIWTDLNRKSEAKIIGHLKKLEERSLWMKDYLAQAKVKMGKVRPEPEFVPKTPSSTTSRPAGRRGRSSTTHEDGNTQPVSVKKSKKKKSSRKSGSKVTTPSPLASRLAKTDQEQSTRDGLDVEATQPEAHGPNEADGGVNSRPSGPAEDHSLPDCGVGSTKESNGVADQSLTNANADDVVCEEDSCLSDLPAEETTDNVAKATMSAVQDLKLSTNHVDEDDDKASEVNQYEVIADCQESDLDGSIDNIVDQSCEVDVGAAVDATFNVTEVVDATFDTSSLPSEIRHKSLEKAHTKVSELANATFDIVSIADEASAEPEAVVSKIHEDVYNPVQSASYQEQLAEAVPANLTATEVAESDADVESEADVLPITAAPKAKSLRKTRTLSLQQKRALANTNESDSDAPASKTRKGERGHKSSRLVDNPLRSKNDSQSSDTAGSVQSIRSKRNTQTEVSARVTRSRSKSQKDSTSDDSIPSAASVNLAPLRRVSARRSSIAASLLKVSAAKRVSIAQLVAEQEVVLVKHTDTPSPILTKSRPAMKTSATPSSSSLNNSRAPAGKVVRPGRKVLASGGRGISPATGPRSGGVGVSGGSQGGMRSRSRMQIINGSTQRTPSGSRAPSNMVAKGASFVSKPRGPNLDEIQEQKEMERRKKEEKEAEAKQRREDLMKKKAEEQKNKNEARIQRVKEARKKQETQKDANKNFEKEKAEKLEALRIREEKAKEAAKRKEIERVEKVKIEAEKRKEQERVDKENSEEEKRKDRERKLEDTRNKEIEEERKRIAEVRKLDEQKRVLAEKQRDAEISLAKQTMVKSVQTKDLNSTYSKPGDITVNNTLEVTQGVSSYDMTPARHELPPEPSQDEDNYGLDDLRSDEDTDDEDCPRKEVPKWAEGTQLRTALLKQCYMGPDVDMIFANVEMPDLSTMFAHQRKRFFKRTSSAVWDTPPESFKHAARRR